MRNNIVLIDSLKNNQEFKIADGEKRTLVIFLCQGNEQSGEIKVIIGGRKADVQILGIILGYGQQKIDLFSFQDHIKPNSRSNLFIKSILFDEAKLHYKGLIRIEKDAQRSDACQKNQNLLMSNRASVVNQPYLEILANDVHCKHGATTGKIDQEQLYYLATRGLSRKEATKMLILGFFQEILQRIPDQKLERELEEKIFFKISRFLERARTDIV